MNRVDKNNFENTVLTNPLVNVVFYKEGVAQCKQVMDFLLEFESQDEFKKIKFFKLDIDLDLEIAQEFSISSVPTLILFRNGNEIDRVVGADTSLMTQKIRKVLESDRSIEPRLKELINKEPIMVFIKGTPQQPRCGFTRTLINLLDQLKIKYGYFDILSDDDVRQSLKIFSKWPTYPQLYVKGSLIGGLDIIQELHQNGELENTLQV